MVASIIIVLYLPPIPSVVTAVQPVPRYPREPFYVWLSFLQFPFSLSSSPGTVTIPYILQTLFRRSPINETIVRFSLLPLLPPPPFTPPYSGAILFTSFLPPSPDYLSLVVFYTLLRTTVSLDDIAASILNQLIDRLNPSPHKVHPASFRLH